MAVSIEAFGFNPSKAHGPRPTLRIVREVMTEKGVSIPLRHTGRGRRLAQATNVGFYELVSIPLRHTGRGRRDPAGPDHVRDVFQSL